MIEEPTRLHADDGAPEGLRALLRSARTDGLDAAAVNRIDEVLRRSAPVHFGKAANRSWPWKTTWIATTGVVVAILVARMLEETPEPGPVAATLELVEEPSPGHVAGAPLARVPAEIAPPSAMSEPTRSSHEPEPATRKRPFSRERLAQPATDDTSTSPVAEAELLLRARRALGPAPARALSLAESHRRNFPEGTLAQERESLAISALLRLGRTNEAETRADQFFGRFPGSPHEPAIRRALAGADDDPSARSETASRDDTNPP